MFMQRRLGLQFATGNSAPSPASPDGFRPYARFPGQAASSALSAATKAIGWSIIT